MSQKFGRGFGLPCSERHPAAPTPPVPARDPDHDLPENRPIKRVLTLAEHALIRQHDARAAMLRQAQEELAFAAQMQLLQKLRDSGGLA